MIKQDFIIQLVALGLGMLVSLIAGCFTEYFLTATVKVKLPHKITRNLPSSDLDGGAKQLGLLEIIIFFTTFWLGGYALGAGWLALKVAAKWASWQHITKIPQENSPNDLFLNLPDRLRLSNYLLGRFLNGTLYNIFCGIVGFFVAKALYKNPQLIKWALPENGSEILLGIGAVWVSVVVVCPLFCSEGK